MLMTKLYPNRDILGMYTGMKMNKWFALNSRTSRFYTLHDWAFILRGTLCNQSIEKKKKYFAQNGAEYFTKTDRMLNGYSSGRAETLHN